jgi:hypothetical protein
MIPIHVEEQLNYLYETREQAIEDAKRWRSLTCAFIITSSALCLACIALAVKVIELGGG